MVAVAAVELVYHWKTDHANHTLILLKCFGLVLAAVAEEIANYHNFGILSRQYQWMKNLFSAARTKLSVHIENEDIEQAQRLMIHHLGLETLDENAN